MKSKEPEWVPRKPGLYKETLSWKIQKQNKKPYFTYCLHACVHAFNCMWVTVHGGQGTCSGQFSMTKMDSGYLIRSSARQQVPFLAESSIQPIRTCLFGDFFFLICFETKSHSLRRWGWPGTQGDPPTSAQAGIKLTMQLWLVLNAWSSFPYLC